MDKDLQQLIEKYQNDFRRYRAAHPTVGAASPAAPDRPAAPMPEIPQNTPGPLPQPEPSIRPDLPPEMPERPMARPEMPEQPPVSLPEMPEQPPVAQPEIPMEMPVMPERPMAASPSPERDVADRRRTDRGYIQVRAYTASEATPVPDALVLVLQDGQLVRQTLTDQDGLTELMELRTVSRELSMEEGTAHPYTTYDLQITAEGYLPVTSLAVPVFGGVTAIQNIAMIPRPEFDTGRQDEVFQNTEPDL